MSSKDVVIRAGSTVFGCPHLLDEGAVFKMWDGADGYAAFLICKGCKRDDDDADGYEGEDYTLLADLTIKHRYETGDA